MRKASEKIFFIRFPLFYLQLVIRTIENDGVKVQMPRLPVD